MSSPTAGLAAQLAKSIDQTLAEQLIEEATELEQSFLLGKWKHSELDGGRFAEVAARIVYSADSGNTSLNKSVDDCLRYVDNQQVQHSFPEPQGAIHLAKVLRAIYKLRSQRGAVHVSATYTANEIDSRLIVECVRWVLADLLRIFLQINREEVATLVRELARFPQPLVRNYGDQPLLQNVTFTIEEEILAHLLEAPSGMTVARLVAVIPKDPSSVRKAAKRLQGSPLRQVIDRGKVLFITDLGTARVEQKVASLRTMPS